MKRYIVIVDEDFAEFVKEVQRYLNMGWKVTGGVCMLPSSPRDVFAQSMYYE